MGVVENVPVRLIRILRVEGSNLRFMDNFKPGVEESLPLDSRFHELATSLPPMRLCKATIYGGAIVDLVPTRAAATRPATIPKRGRTEEG